MTLYLYDLDGNFLFKGTKAACRAFVQENKDLTIKAFNQPQRTAPTEKVVDNDNKEKTVVNDFDEKTSVFGKLFI